MLKGKNIILFSSDDWDSGLKTSKYHVAVRFARENRVLFINSLGLKAPKLRSSGLSKILNRIHQWVRAYRKINPHLYVHTPVVLPFQGMKAIQRLNRFVLINSIRSLQKRLRLTNPIVLIFIPTAVDVIGHLNERGVVYYCIDELTGYEYVDERNLIKLEDRLLAKADCVIASSAELADAKRKANKNTVYMPHGVDWGLFRSAVEQDLEIPGDIAGIKKPIIGFYGYISEDWVDSDLLKQIGNLRPDWSIVLIGKSAIDMTKLTAQKNIHFLGVKPFEDLPKYAKAFDVAIIPFKINKLTLNSNPLKLLEYLAAGKPIVSVDIPEVAKHKGMVEIESTSEGFVKAIERSLEEDSVEEMYKRSDYVKSESWDSRIDIISEFINRSIFNDK